MEIILWEAAKLILAMVLIVGTIGSVAASYRLWHNNDKFLALIVIVAIAAWFTTAVVVRLIHS